MTDLEYRYASHGAQHDEYLRLTGQDPAEDALEREQAAAFGDEAQARLDLYPSEARNVRRLPARTTAPGAGTPEAA